MEDLEYLAEFIERYPQKVSGKLDYSFIGGSSIRLHQEKFGSLDKRPISDLDLLAFNGKNYFVDSFVPDDFLDQKNSRSPISNEELRHYSLDVNLANFIGEAFFMDSNFLAVSKSCGLDQHARPKDYKDLKTLEALSGFDNSKLERLYDSAKQLNVPGSFAADLFEWVIDSDENNYSSKSVLFQAFPQFSNISYLFKNPEKPKSILLDHVSYMDEEKGYSISSILHNSYKIISHLHEFGDSEKSAALKNLLKYSDLRGHIGFDRDVNEKYLSSIKFGKTKEKMGLINQLPNKL